MKWLEYVKNGRGLIWYTDHEFEKKNWENHEKLESRRPVSEIRF
jgi:hypothetical protein